MEIPLRDEIIMSGLYDGQDNVVLDPEVSRVNYNREADGEIRLARNRNSASASFSEQALDTNTEVD